MEEKRTCKNGECHDTPIRGISCDVKNCAYHEGECHCCAPRISVGPCNATCSGDTVCVTFKPKES